MKSFKTGLILFIVVVSLLMGGCYASINTLPPEEAANFNSYAELTKAMHKHHEITTEGDATIITFDKYITPRDIVEVVVADLDAADAYCGAKSGTMYFEFDNTHVVKTLGRMSMRMQDGYLLINAPVYENTYRDSGSRTELLTFGERLSKMPYEKAMEYVWNYSSKFSCKSDEKVIFNAATGMRSTLIAPGHTLLYRVEEYL